MTSPNASHRSSCPSGGCRHHASDPAGSDGSAPSGHGAAAGLRSALTVLPLAALLAVASACAQGDGARGAVDYDSVPGAAGAPYDTAFFGSLQWRNIGPNRGGRSIGVAGHRDRPNTYYFGATGGGLWKSTDGGEEWFPVTDGQVTSSSVGAVAMAPSDPEVVYIGMGEVQLRGSITQGDGVYRSTDGGETWSHLGLEETQAVARVRVHPDDADVAYVAALGHPYGPNPERGVFKTTDGGDSWEKVLFVSDSAGAVDLILDPNDPETVYASTWQVYRTPWKMWGGGPHSGLFKSTDGGETWTELTDNPGMPEPPLGKIGITVSRADSDRLYAIVEAHEGGVFRSDDGGETWQRTNSERKIRQRHFYYSRIYAHPTDPDVSYALNTRLYISRDGGVTYEPVDQQPPHGDQHDLWIDPDDPERMINGSDGGGSVTVNAGESWTDQEYPTAQFYHVMTTDDYPYHVCGAQQDNSTACVQSADWKNEHNPDDPIGDWLYQIGGGEQAWIRQDPNDPNTFFAGHQGAVLTKYDRSTGQVRDVQPYPRFFSGEAAAALPERWQWTFPIVFNRVNGETIYTSSQHVWKTTDDGQSWTKISPDLSYADSATMGPSGGLITGDMNGPEIYATVFALAPSRLEEDVIWAGTDDGRVWITRDEGGEWTEITPPDMEKYTRVSIIDPSKHDPATAYVAANRYQMDDRSPYLWKTHDYGETWTRIDDGITGFTRTIREDPARPGLLYAGTEHGVWVSFDDGEQWQPLKMATKQAPDDETGGYLPDTPVRGLVVEENDLVIGSHGRGFWIMDDIGPLRQIRAEVAESDVHLFEPRTATRRTEGEGTGEEDPGPAVFQYWLAEQPEELTVEVLDAGGNVVRTFEGPRPDDYEPEERAGYTPPPPAPPEGDVGMNTYTWDLRYPGSLYFEGQIIWNASTVRGPMAPPGEYQVRLTVDGESQTRSFRVRKDPRLEGITDRDLRAQFELAVQIRDATDRANRAVVQARETRRQTAERLTSVAGTEVPEGDEGWVTMDEAMQVVEQVRGEDAELADAAEALLRAQREVETALYQTKNRSGQDPLGFPIRLNNRLSALRRSVETGNAPPTAGHRQVYDELTAELEEQLSAMDATVAEELAALNNLLEQRNLEPVESERGDGTGGGGEAAQ